MIYCPLTSVSSPNDRMTELWQQCVTQLEAEVSEQEINTWIRPLQPNLSDGTLILLAPNRFVLEKVELHYLTLIKNFAAKLTENPGLRVSVQIGNSSPMPPSDFQNATIGNTPDQAIPPPMGGVGKRPNSYSVNPEFSINTFVTGKSNQLARGAAEAVIKEPGSAYNPLFIYGGVGLGKTHLMHAIGNEIKNQRPRANVAYLASERFVSDMVRALQNNKIENFKSYYRSLDVLLIDDIQFFAGKERSQEEFFHTFNALVEGHQQVILTSDRYPKELDGLEERLKSRFGWGLTVPIESPDKETRVAILQSKATQFGVDLPEDVAFLIAGRIRSNIRELEGALRRVSANALFTGQAITLDFATETLRDLLSAQDKMITLDNIKKTVCEYYNVRSQEMQSKSRKRSLVRPRQIAMTLSKELTRHSLPEIGQSFARDHTTVIHAQRTIEALRKEDERLDEDYQKLIRKLSH